MGDIVQVNDQGLKVANDQGVIQTSLGISDGFEDGDIIEWSGDKTYFEVNTSNPHSGSYCLDTTGSAGSRQVIVHDSSTGYTYIEVWTNQQYDPAVSGPVLNKQSGVEDYYHCWQSVDAFILDRIDGGSKNNLGLTTVSASENDWYKQVLYRNGDDIIAEIYDNTDTLMASISAVDATYSGGKIGIVGQGNDRPTQYDDILIQE